MMTLLYTPAFFWGLGIGFVIGLVVGILSIRLFKGQIDTIKMLNIGFFFVWVGMHLYGFFNSITVPFLFDVAGFASVGHLFGFDLGSTISSIIKK